MRNEKGQRGKRRGGVGTTKGRREGGREALCVCVCVCVCVCACLRAPAAVSRTAASTGLRWATCTSPHPRPPIHAPLVSLQPRALSYSGTNRPPLQARAAPAHHLQATECPPRVAARIPTPLRRSRISRTPQPSATRASRPAARETARSVMGERNGTSGACSAAWEASIGQWGREGGEERVGG